MAVHYNTGLKLTKPQTILGWCYLPFYLVLTSWLIGFTAKLLGVSLDNFTLNLLYFAVNFVFVLLVYQKFLRKSIRGFTEHFWKFIQTLILGYALYLFATFFLQRLLLWLMGDFTVVNNEVVGGYIAQNRSIMLLCSVVIAPLVEEVLVRGVVFGSFHRINRILAYVMSVLLFSFMHVWPHVSSLSLPMLLANGLCYVPAAVALGWTYEKSGTIWCPILLHALINAISYGAYTIF